MGVLALKTVFEPTIFKIVSQVTGIPPAEVNDQTVVPAEFRTAVIEKVTADLSTDTLIFGNETNLTAGQIAEEAEKRY